MVATKAAATLRKEEKKADQHFKNNQSTEMDSDSDTNAATNSSFSSTRVVKYRTFHAQASANKFNYYERGNQTPEVLSRVSNDNDSDFRKQI
jgi:hypothetical protein